ncbi:MAG TPA: SprT family zinc-dependent metalloprotease [Patescibacteria group bacterium]|nr:SprT family zinc-dependent metalloprotease [Patescibacteria group bacterium]
MNIEIHRVKRKTLSLQVTAEGGVLIKAPTWLPQHEIDSFLHRKQRWITQRLAAAYKTKQEANTAFFLGCKYQVELRRHLKKGLIREKVILPELNSTKALEKLYQAEAKHYLPVRLKELSEFTGITDITRVVITGAKTRFGSRSSKGTIALSWRLMPFSPEVIDYVIIHELCHVRHMNHSASFWAEVTKYCPEYKLLRKILKE